MSIPDVVRAVAIALGRDVEDESMFFATAKGICDRNARLEAENDGYLGELSRMRLEVELLRNENAKLRGLVDYMTPIAWYAASERERDRMRELGVEV